MKIISLVIDKYLFLYISFEPSRTTIKSSVMSKRAFLSTFFFFFLLLSGYSYNLRELSTREGLSNSSILSMCQDSDRFMWLGTADGLNMYDGLNIQTYKPTPNNPYSLSGTMIDVIMEAQPGILWIGTNYGLNRFDKSTRKIEYHTQFKGKYFLAKSKENEVFVISNPNHIEFYNKRRRVFESISYKGIEINEIMRFFIDEANVLWIFYFNGQISNAKISFNASKPILKLLNDFKHEPKISSCFYNKNTAFIMDENYDLFELKPTTRKMNFIKNLRKEISGKGSISDIIRDNDDILIGFQTNGLLKLKSVPDKEQRYYGEYINVKYRIMSLLKDTVQDIVWIGTDGQGVIEYSKNSFSIKSNELRDFPYQITKQIRAMFLDKLNNLWIGTRDNGVLKIADYTVNSNLQNQKAEFFTTTNSALSNNSNYIFQPSRKNILWIGGDGPGLNYYSYKEKRIKLVKSRSAVPTFHVHSMCEISDSILWLATGGWGLLKVKISWENDNPIIEHIQIIKFSKKQQITNHFFSVCQENDSILWFGNRRYGVLRLNVNTSRFKSIKFHENNLGIINDILCIHKDSKGKMWFGSSFGITRLDSFSKRVVKFKNFNERNGLPNNTIHGIIEDERGRFWLSTNRGIVEFNPQKETFKTYSYSNGLNVVEFSDGAYSRNKEKGIIFFGGTNGFVTITQDTFFEQKFIPTVFFTGIKLFEKEYNLSSLMKITKGKKYLELNHDQNFFSISFLALDHIDGQNYNYSYYLENLNKNWINNGFSNVVTYTDISPGEYTLHVKCRLGTENFGDKIYSLKIVILPPWYLTIWAYLIYSTLFLLIFYYSIRLIKRRYEQNRKEIDEKLELQRKEELYESKLSFFTNITHELCTPITLIYGPSKRLISYQKSDNYVKKYANSILNNAERLNSLIQEIIEFRKSETSDISCKIKTINMSEVAKEITDSFIELAANKQIEYNIDIEDNILWNSDKNCFTKILTNLVSNALKYTQKNGTMSVSLHLKENTLELIVLNTGKGIEEKDIPFVFNKYTVFDNFDSHDGGENYNRNGLGLAICYNMVKLLNGEINVKSTSGEKTVFSVLLPFIETSEPNINKGSEPESALSVKDSIENSQVKSKPTILIVDDDIEMLEYVSDIFSSQYNVLSEANSGNVFEILNHTLPNIIISDIMMPGTDGLSLTKKIRSNKKTTHIPLILLSAKSSAEERIEGIEAGAEVYVTKPFDEDYLKAIVDRLLQRQDILKGYYNSAISAFEFMDGQFTHKDDKLFFEKIIQIIHRNAETPIFTADKLAKEIGISSRQLYRRLASITNKTPSDLIKEYKLVVVEKLLVSTNLTIEEIMYKTGYSNRGNFYKIFSEKYGITPKSYRDQKKKEVDNESDIL